MANYDDQTFQLCLDAHVGTMTGRAASEEFEQDFRVEARRLFQRYELARGNVEGFPDQHIDLRIFEDCTPEQKAFIHYLSTASYQEEGKFTIPFACRSMDDYESFIMAYLHEHEPEYLKKAIYNAFDAARKQSTRLHEDQDFFENEVDQEYDAHLSCLGYADSPKELTRDQIAVQVKTSDREKVEDLSELIDKTQFTRRDHNLVFDGIAYMQFPGLKVVYLTDMSEPRDITKSIFFIQDEYRLLPEHRVRNIIDHWNDKR